MKQSGFTLVELMVIIVIIGILASTALPAYAPRIHQARVEQSIQFTKFAREEIEMFYKKYRKLPQNNAEAGLPHPDKFISNYTQRVEVVNGALHITYGNRVSEQAEDKIISIRPAIVKSEPSIPISWIVAYASVPEGLDVIGENRTDIDSSYVGYDYRW